VTATTTGKVPSGVKCFLLEERKRKTPGKNEQGGKSQKFNYARKF
jgi:hypothetical protein